MLQQTRPHVTATATEKRELIPGYFAVERLGSGGYGEVWKVEAPGGLHKAIKLVYGYHGDERASRELKALHRVKELRHPFLLSLERIEVVDSRLMIVTELADKSLIDRFQECRDKKMPGIPREELIAHLSDAADALDYMLEHQSLQHLDVKPENLLVVGGRVKIADFGLVKELANQTRSLVGGMTPTYAAPELFDGRASEQSDQYSLAIVYQEMLTGILPFPGQTPAQLAAQHTQSAPQLNVLPAHDRPIIAQALSKEPTQRFGSCRELVNALRDSVLRAESKRGSSHKSAPQQGEHDTRTVCIDDTRSTESEPAGKKRDSSGPLATHVMEAPRSAPRPPADTPILVQQRPVVEVSSEVINLAFPPCDTQSEASAPTLLVGVGGTGMSVLLQFKRQLQQQNAAVIGDVHMLAFDTDRSAVKRMSAEGLEHQDIALLRLRDPSQYRAESQQLLKWIGRRWLYNVPKSGETCGFRPLGRLALVDHAGVAVAKLRQRLALLFRRGEDGAEPDEAPNSGEATGPRPRVFIVGSCAGGTGGGMMMELAYAIRKLAEQLSDGPIDLHAVITHATNRCKTTKQLAIANTYSFLTELQHYALHGGLGSQADPRRAIFEGAGFPLDDIYFVRLGDDLNNDQFTEQTTNVAGYLLANLTPPTGGLLDGIRRQRQPIKTGDADLKIRSFFINTFAGLDPQIPAHIADALAADVRAGWMLEDRGSKAMNQLREENESAEEKPAPETLDAQLAKRLGPLAHTRIGGIIWTFCRSRHATSDDRQRAKQPTIERLNSVVEVSRAQLEEIASTELDEPRLEEIAQAIDVRSDNLRRILSQTSEYLAEKIVERFLQAAWRQSGQSEAKQLTVSLPTLLNDETSREAYNIVGRFASHTEVAADGQLRPAMGPLLDLVKEQDRYRFDLGCGRRTMIVGPQPEEMQAAVDKQTNRPCLIVRGNSPNLTYCEELQDISLAQLASTILGELPEIKEVAQRIHTRSDITWSEPAEVVEIAMSPARDEDVESGRIAQK